MASSPTRRTDSSASGWMRSRSSTCLATAASATSLTATPDSLAMSILNGCPPRSMQPQSMQLQPSRSPPTLAPAALGVRVLLARRERASGPAPGVVPFEGVDDVADQPVPHDIMAGQTREVDIVETFQYLLHDAQAAPLPGP